MERIVEEFRRCAVCGIFPHLIQLITLTHFRYKVRTEIARKQKDAENKQALLNVAPTAVGYSNGAGSSFSLTEKSQLQQQSSSYGLESASTFDEIHRLKAQLEEQEARWRAACEKIAKENETLRNVGGEAVLATQWRVRYESCLREKEDLSERLKSYTRLSDQLEASGNSPEQAYIELQDDFRVISISIHVTCCGGRV